jgi:DNA modification methylase
MAQESKGAGQQFLFDPEPVIKGFPELRWTGKRPYRSTQYYPAQLRESYGDPSVSPDGKPWMNKIYWGDNLQVMSHLLKDYRGKVDLIYIDPPFDSKADYKKKIKLRGKAISNDTSAFEEKQYGDIWTADEYLQFMFERLIIMRELLSDTGSIYLHCDWHRSAQLRLLLDEVFGPDHFRNEIVWSYFGFKRATSKKFPQKHDLIFSYTKSSEYTWHVQYKPHSEEYIKRFKKDANGRLYRDDVNPTGGGSRVIYLDEVEGDIIDSVWDDIPPVNPVAKDRQNYPTQKPVKLVERIINASTNPGDLVFDCFMGSGTTQAAALNTGRRFLGADINLGAVQTTTKRLLQMTDTIDITALNKMYLGFEVYNVNNYDFFRNPVEAKDILVQALDIQPLSAGSCFDGELDGRMVKILPTNRIATRADLEGLVADLPYNIYDARREENPNTPVDHITLVCMGHEPDLKAAFEAELSEYKVDVEIVDVLQDKRELEFKREAEANVAVEGGRLVIKSFYPMNLLQKLSLQKEAVGDWRELVESVMVDWNYDGAVMEPTVIDIPERDEFVAGTYDVPDDAGRIKVKITDVLSESLEVEVGA